MTTTVVSTNNQVATVTAVPTVTIGPASSIGLGSGTGSPEGVVTGVVGDVWRQSDGTNGTALWAKRSGTGSTGWAQVPFTLGVFNVKDYGAKGDGVTDDTTAIQAAITAAAVAGGTVVALAGNYLLTTPITGWGAGTILQGMGMGATTFTFSNASAKKIFTVSASYVQFSDFTLDCGSGGTVGQTGFSFEGGCNYGLVERVHLINVGQYGVSYQDSGTNGGGAGFIFRDNVIDLTNGVPANTSTGIEFFPRGGAGFLATPGPLVSGNTILGNTNSAVGIKVDQSLGARIVHNRVNGILYASGQAGITGVGNRDHLIAHNHVDQCRLGITVSGSISVDNGLANAEVTVAENHVTRYTTYGLFAGQSVDGLLVRGNIFDVDGATGTLGVRFDQTGGNGDYTGVAITGNRFLGGATIALVSDSTTTYGYPRAQILANHITGGVSWGISVSGTNSVDLMIADNLLYQTTKFGGIVINNGAARAKLTGNKILDCNTSATTGSGGIDLNSTNAEVSENHIENISAGNVHTGIIVRTGTAVTLRQNRIVGMLTAPISTSGGGTLASVAASVASAIGTPTETVLVSGVDASQAGTIKVTLTADRVVGAPLLPMTGQRLSFLFVQDSSGAHAVTWNAVFKVSWSDTGNSASKRSSVAFVYDGTNWNQDGAQSPYL